MCLPSIAAIATTPAAAFVMLLAMAEEGVTGGTELGAKGAEVAGMWWQVLALNVVVDVGGLALGAAVQALPQP
jgi:hypothetical protein